METEQGRSMRAAPSTTRVLRVEIDGRVLRLTPERHCSIGRDPTCDVVVDHTSASRRHGQLQWNETHWVYRDEGSANGSWSDGRRITELPIRERTEVRLGSRGLLLVLAPERRTPARIEPVPRPRAPLLRVETEGHLLRLSSERSWSIGREPGCDVVVNHASSSRRHAELLWSGTHWVYRDLGSANGSWAGGRRISQLPIRERTEVRLGNRGPLLVLAPEPAAPAVESVCELPGQDASDPSLLGLRTRAHTIPGQGLTIGRTPDNDLVLPDLAVSRHHAAVRRAPGGSLEIVDLGSSNGTYVDGRRIRSAQLAERSIVAIGSHLFRLGAGALQEYAEAQGAWLCALDLGVLANRRVRLLAGISFALEPSGLLGIVGPSGAGKTTLLKALTGQQAAQEGRVLYGGRDLYASLDLRQRMGYVPQEDQLHPQLNVRQALGYAAELRFARDVSTQARHARIDEVLHELGLEHRQDSPIARLSGGERKRVSVAAELLTKPPLLFLDEPTSGLDPGNEQKLTALLRDLAGGGRTVVTATHSVVALEQCDLVLVLATGGHQAYYGPPDTALAYFHAHDWGTTYPQVFASLTDAAGETFASAFRRDPIRREFVEQPIARAQKNMASEGAVASPARPTRRSETLRQWQVLTKRYLAVLIADRTSSLILLAQAPFFALLYALLYPNNVMSTATASEATILLWLLVLGATWMGVSNSIREVVKEQAILRREHGLGLSLGAYVASKLTVLASLTTIQCVVLALATMSLHRIPAVDPVTHVAIPAAGLLLRSGRLELALDVAVAGLASMGLGLLLSGLVRNADQANFVLPLILVAQVVLSAPVLGSPGPVFAALGTVSTAQWGTAAVAATTSLNVVRRPYLQMVEQQRATAEGRPVNPEVVQGQSQWDHRLSSWALDVLALVAIGAASIAGLYLILVGQLRPRQPMAGGPPGSGPPTPRRAIAGR